MLYIMKWPVSKNYLMKPADWIFIFNKKKHPEEPGRGLSASIDWGSRGKSVSVRRKTEQHRLMKAIIAWIWKVEGAKQQQNEV